LRAVGGSSTERLVLNDTDDDFDWNDSSSEDLSFELIQS